jgi:FkbM family methyltransferase
MFLGDYEKEEAALLMKNVGPGMTVLDIGANIGYFTLLLATMVGPEGQVHAFEPNPAMHKRLQGNLALNVASPMGQVRVHSCALGAQAGTLDFFCPVLGFEGVGGLKDIARAPVQSVIQVPVVTLDQLVEQQELTHLDFIKMDIEGGELDVLRGAERTLSTLRPTILFEAYELNTAPYGYRVFEILSYLEARNYTVKQAGLGYNFIATPRSQG